MLYEDLNRHIDELINTQDDFRKNEYEFIPLEIRIKLGSPVMLSYPWINLDGLISHLLAQRILKEVYYQLPSGKVINSMSMLPIPIKKFKFNDDFLFYSSVSRFSNPIFSKDTIYKKIAPKDLEYLKSRKQKFDNVRGDFKQHAITFIQNNSPECVFYCNGDKKKIENLLLTLDCLGKKRSLGKGRVLSIKINVIEQDFSLVHPEFRVNRPIPLEFLKPLGLERLQDDSAISILAYKIPYWNKNNHKLCIAPGGF